MAKILHDGQACGVYNLTGKYPAWFGGSEEPNDARLARRAEYERTHTGIPEDHYVYDEVDRSILHNFHGVCGVLSDGSFIYAEDVWQQSLDNWGSTWQTKIKTCEDASPKGERMSEPTELAESLKLAKRITSSHALSMPHKDNEKYLNREIRMAVARVERAALGLNMAVARVERAARGLNMAVKESVDNYRKLFHQE